MVWVQAYLAQRIKRQRCLADRRQSDGAPRRWRAWVGREQFVDERLTADGGQIHGILLVGEFGERRFPRGRRPWWEVGAQQVLAR